MSINLYFSQIATGTALLTNVVSIGSFFSHTCSIVSFVCSIISTLMHAFKAVKNLESSGLNCIVCTYINATISSLIASIFSAVSLSMYPNIKPELIIICFIVNCITTVFCAYVYEQEVKEITASNLPILMSQIEESEVRKYTILKEKINLAQEELEKSQNILRDLETKLEAFSLSEDDSNLDELVTLLLNIEQTKQKIEIPYNTINQLREELQSLTLEPLLPPPYSEQLRPNETQANNFDLDRNGRPIEVCIDMVSDSISLLKQTLKTLLQNLKIINDKLANEIEQPLTQEEINTLISERDAIIEQISQTYKDIIKSETTVQLPSYSSRCGSKELTVEQA